MTYELTPFCPYYASAVEMIGRRWAGAVLRALLAGETRFGGIAEAIPDMTDRLLSRRLKDLEADGLVDRIVSPTTPVTIEYRLTPKGQALGTVVSELTEWAHQWLVPIDEPDTGHAQAAEAA